MRAFYRRINLTLVALMSAVLLALTGCVQLPPEPPGTDTSATPDVAGRWVVARADVERVREPDVATTDVAQVVAGDSAFAFDLYHAVRKDQGNIFYSPYSISVALAMTYAGARGDTERELANTLHYTLPQSELHPAFNALQLDLSSRGQEVTGAEEQERFQLNIVNALWGQVDYHFEQAFLATLARFYGAGLRLLDFASNPEESSAIINAWVSEATEGRIKDLLKPGVITGNTRLVLTNAIYFTAAWVQPFPENNTQDKPFRRPDGDQVMVPMMSQIVRATYAQGNDYQAVALPYRHAPVSMLILLPDAARFGDFEAALSAERVQDVLDSLQPADINLTMPKFEYDAALDLSQTLADMGMPAAFGAGADFSAMTGDRSLYISDVVHKAFVAVDEEGTEAAASTAVAMAESAMALQPTVTVDHSFIFLIRDDETGTILFMGRVLDPTAQ
jgi:serpin B